MGVMILTSIVMDDGDRAAAIALGYGAAQTVTAVLLGWRVRRLIDGPPVRRTGRIALGSLGAAGAAAVVMGAVQSRFGDDRLSSLSAIGVAGAAGVVVFVLALRAMAGVGPRGLVARGAGGG
ncbi:MAG: hypothetical protein H6514_17215 [Acidimicrobiaceae bacterium]|nr:hypothetical protein [Acidimicrobiaceae bacterium]